MSTTRHTLTSRLRRRRALKLLAVVSIALVLTSSVLVHVGAFGGSLTRAARLDQQQVAVITAIDGDTVRVRTAAGEDVLVGLLGVDAPKLPAEHWARRSLDYTKARLVGREVTLRVEPTESADGRGRVLAYVYGTDADVINADIIRDGQAYADRRVRHPLAKQFEQLEIEPRKKQRGLWQGLRDDDMPRWRREWLKHWREEHAS
jgi:endonuclease YncB( thermonuclease family)